MEMHLMHLLYSFAIVILIYRRQYFYAYGDSCTCDNSTQSMDCAGVIPQSVPVGIINVHIVDVTEVITNNAFLDPSWKSIHRLSVVSGDSSNVELYDFTFWTLSEVIYLQLSLQSLKIIHSKAFHGLDHLKTLALTNCVRVFFESFYNVMMDLNNFPRMQVLMVNRLSNYNTLGGLSMNKTLIECMEERNITEIHIDYARIDFIDLTAIHLMGSSLRKVSARHTIISKVHAIYPISCRSLVYLDLSGFTLWYPLDPINIVNAVIDVSLHVSVFRLMLPSLRVLKLDDILSSQSYAKNATVIANYDMITQIREVSLKNNMCEYMDIVLDTNMFPYLERIEFQNNGLEYANPKFLIGLVSLKFVNASENYLYRMENNKKTPLGELFRYAKNLEILDLSKNGLAVIPIEILTVNLKVKRLHLGFNNIKDFNLTNAPCLKYLDLQSNRIGYIDSDNRHAIDMVLKRSDGTFRINLRDNPLICSCEKRMFLSWFLKSPVFDINSKAYTCLYDGSYHVIDEILVNKLNEDCDRASNIRKFVIVAIISVAMTVFMSIVLFFIIRISCRNMKRRKLIQKGIRSLNEHTLEYEFPIFISYSNTDVDFVFEHIIYPINQHLREITELDDDTFVATGDQQFRAGFSIHDEIQRCIEQSAVMLVVVSNAYCTSAYCRNEIETSVELDKPVVLLFLEEVNEANMPKVMRRVFKKCVRAKMNYVDGQLQVVPSWENICNSLLELIG